MHSIPDFIPSDEEFSFVPYCYCESDGDEKLNYNLAVLKEGERREPKEEPASESDSESIMGTQSRTFYIVAIIIGTVIVIALLILFVLIVRNRRNAAEDPEENGSEDDDDDDEEEEEEDEDEEDDDTDRDEFGEEDEYISKRSLVWESNRPKRKCTECSAAIIPGDATYCAVCGARLTPDTSDRDQFLHGKSRYKGYRSSPPRDGREHHHIDFTPPRFKRPPRRPMARRSMRRPPPPPRY